MLIWPTAAPISNVGSPVGVVWGPAAPDVIVSPVVKLPVSIGGEVG